jgi:anaerobic selenocysteine-containing dehydrogenase
LLVHPDDIARLGLADGQMIHLVSEWRDGVERTAPGFRVVAYQTARGCCGAYFPETNVLVPLDSTAEGSNTPMSKSVSYGSCPRDGRFDGQRMKRPRTTGRTGQCGGGDATSPS